MKRQILLIDDELVLLETVGFMLEALGYHVSRQLDGVSAVNFFASMHDQIDLVLLDLIMPNMDGSETYQKLLLLDPTVKVIFMSGFSNTLGLEGLLNQKSTFFLQKPFGLSELERILYQSGLK